MNRRLKDRLGDALLVVIFVAVLAGCAFAIVKIMTTWKVKGLG
jgi:hypothetical protein